MIWLALLLLTSAAVFVWLCLRAPEGFQDSAGFHFGSPPQIADGEGTDFQAVYHASRDEAECLSRARPDRSFHLTTDSAGGTRNHAR
jgi:hypothetical protein